MTLADLAALAEAKVPGFKRPTGECLGCDGSGGVFVWYGETRETAYGSRCEQCGNTGRVYDNSPAALAMSVLRCGVRSEVHFSLLFRKSWRSGERAMDVALRSDGSGNPVWMDMAVADTDESIARALLTALLRAHGVEVAG